MEVVLTEIVAVNADVVRPVDANVAVTVGVPTIDIEVAEIIFRLLVEENVNALVLVTVGTDKVELNEP